MPVDTAWHWYWALFGNSTTTSYIYSEARKTKKVNNLEPLIEASGDFSICVVEIVRQRTLVVVEGH